MPGVLLFVTWIGAMFGMNWYWKHKSRRDDAPSNWTAQIINALNKTCLLLGMLFGG